MNKMEKLSRLPVFKEMSDLQLEDLLFSQHGNGNVKTYKRGDMVKMQGDECRGLYVLTEGTVRCTMGGIEGKTVTVELIQAPGLLAPAFIFASDNHFPVDVWAETDCQVILVGRNHLLRFMSAHPTFMQNMVQLISNRCAFLSKRLNDFAVNSLKQRIMKYMKENGGIENQSEAARHLGVARPSLSRALAEMERDGLLDR